MTTPSLIDWLRALASYARAIMKAPATAGTAPGVADCRGVDVIDRTCAVEGCGRGGKLTRGMCAKHYRYWLDHTPKDCRPAPPSAQRDFWNHVQKTHDHGCWVWTGPTNRAGYGMWGRVLAHRHSWATANHPIPDGAWILHTCDNPPCVNPRHLYAGTRDDNVRDAVTRGRMAKTRKTHCAMGHEKSGDNLIVVMSRGYECHRCRRCENVRKAAVAAAAVRRKGLVRPRVEQHERDRICELRRAGMQYREIALTVGRSQRTIHSTLNEAGLCRS